MGKVNRDKKADEARREVRRSEVVKGLLAGKTYREIGEANGVTHTTVKRDVEVIVERWKAEQVQDMDDKRQLDLERVNVALKAIWPKVEKGNLLAVDRLDKLLERRAKLLGLNMPAKIAATDPSGDEPAPGIFVAGGFSADYIATMKAALAYIEPEAPELQNGST